MAQQTDAEKLLDGRSKLWSSLEDFSLSDGSVAIQSEKGMEGIDFCIGFGENSRFTIFTTGRSIEAIPIGPIDPFPTSIGQLAPSKGLATAEAKFEI